VTGTLTRMYSEQSGQDFMGGAGVISFYSHGGSMNGFAKDDGLSHPITRGSGLGIPSPPAVCFRKSKRAQTDQDDETWVDDGAANTLNRFDQGDTRTTHTVIEPTTVRRLTPLECERLMGLPDGWTAPVGVKAPDSKRYAACGDAIVTWVAYWIAKRIRMIEEEA